MNTSSFDKASLDYLKKEFGITIQTTSKSLGGKEVLPRTFADKGITLPSDLEKALNHWRNSYTIDKPNLHQRIQLWQILDQMAHNNGPVSKTVKLYKNETIGSKISHDTIQVKARTRKQERWIKTFLQKAGYTKANLEAIVEDLVTLGNSIAINSLTPTEGIAETTLADPFSLQERIEFNPVRIKHQVEGGYYGYDKLSQTDSRMQQLLKAIDDPDMATSEYFKSTLIGYRIDDFVFAPWQVAHFRMPSSRHEFAPYGKPLLLSALAPYMTWKATKELIALARIASFPKEVVTLMNAESTPIDMMFQRLQELKEIEENLSDYSAQDATGVGQKIFTIDGVFKYDLKSTSMDLSSIGDLDADEENVISALDVPIAYLIQGKEKGFGDSNKTLVAQSKVFAKAVYSIQSAILEQLVTQVKIQMTLTGEYDPDKDYFELSMPLPTVDDDPELVRLYQERLRLAKDTAETIRDLLGFTATAKLPQDTIRSILSSLSVAPKEDLDMWVSEIANGTEETINVEDSDPILQEHFIKIREVLTPDLMREAIMKTRQESCRYEGVEDSRHFMASSSTSSLDKRFLESMKATISTIKLKETSRLKESLEEAKKTTEVVNTLRKTLYGVTADFSEIAKKQESEK